MLTEISTLQQYVNQWVEENIGNESAIGFVYEESQNIVINLKDMDKRGDNKEFLKQVNEECAACLVEDLTAVGYENYFVNIVSDHNFIVSPRA